MATVKVDSESGKWNLVYKDIYTMVRGGFFGFETWEHKKKLTNWGQVE